MECGQAVALILGCCGHSGEDGLSASMWPPLCAKTVKTVNAFANRQQALILHFLGILIINVKTVRHSMTSPIVLRIVILLI